MTNASAAVPANSLIRKELSIRPMGYGDIFRPRKFTESGQFKHGSKEDLQHDGSTAKTTVAGGDVNSRAQDDNREPVDLRNGKDSRDMPEAESDLPEIDDANPSLELDEPPPEILEYARKVLGESEEVKCQTIQELRDMIYERGECLPHRMDDEYLLRFLRARSFNVRKAHRLIANYCHFREEHPEIHRNVNPLKMRHIGEDDVITVPNYRTQCERRIMIYRMGNWDPRKYSVEEIFKATLLIIELGIMEPKCQIFGGVAIFDLAGITTSHAWTVTPQVAKMVISLMVTASPMKTYAMHILNQPWIFDTIFAMFKPLLDKRMQERIFFHGNNMESLHRHIWPTCLPKRYGGTREELPYHKWFASLPKVPKIVKELRQLGYILPDDDIKRF